jgi:hypothetical protein
MKQRNAIIAAAVVASGLLFVEYAKSRVHDSILPHSATVPTTPKALPATHQNQPIYELTADQKVAVDRALESHRPPSTQGEFEYLLLNPSQNRLSLTAAQIAALQAAYDRLREARFAYEASIARVSTSDGGSVKIDIPAYPERGAALQSSFRDDLTARVGPDTAKAILGEYGEYLNARNADNGQQIQSYLVSSDPANPGFTKVVLNWSQPDGMKGSLVSQVSPANYFFFGALSAFFPANK